jgi:PAS domain S-box-containing protein
MAELAIQVRGFGTRNLREWSIQILDALLSQEQRQLPPVELGRYRVLAGALLLLITMNTAYLLFIPLYPAEMRPGRLGGCLVGMAGYALVLALLRRGTSPILPSIIMCAAVTLGLTSATLMMPDARVSSHAAGMLIPALAVYLLGARRSFLFVAFYAFNVGIFHQLFHTGFGQKRDIFSDQAVWISNFVTAVALMFGWALGLLYSTSLEEASTAQEESNTALQKALRTLRESEGKLVSLIESTDDVVMALDAEGHVVSANQAARGLFHELLGDELPPGALLFSQHPRAAVESLRSLFTRAQEGRRVRMEVDFSLGGRRLTLETTASPVLSEEERVVGVTFFGRDITARKEAETRMAELHRNLLDVSRQAGMAEVATGVLHNVGNTLNSVNVSAGLVTERLRGSRVVGLVKATQLVEEHAASLSSFLSEDVRGRQLPSYLVAVSRQLLQEREALLAEMKALNESVEHMKAVVSMQQGHARQAGLMEQVPVAQLLDDAMKLHTLSFEKHGIPVRREYAEVPPVMTDRHKLLQIVFNLLGNARQALLESGRGDKQLTLRVRRVDGRERLRIEVEDNGVGIAPQHLDRMFTQGFTTKKDGHGFGLHISALAAADMGGALTCASAGPGKGATFILELPFDATCDEPGISAAA